MHAARTAAHCAEVYGVPEGRLIAVRRVAKAIDRILEGDRAPDAVDSAAKLLKKQIKAPALAEPKGRVMMVRSAWDKAPRPDMVRKSWDKAPSPVR